VLITGHCCPGSTSASEYPATTCIKYRWSLVFVRGELGYACKAVYATSAAVTRLQRRLSS
jgi:hypothetical protein